MMKLPRRAHRLVRDLMRLGFDVHLTRGGAPVSTNEIKGLAAVVNDEVKTLRNKAEEVNTKLRTALGDAHATLTHVDDMTDDLNRAIGELNAALGQHTNGPPKDNG